MAGSVSGSEGIAYGGGRGGLGDDPIQVGIRAAVERLGRHGLDMPHEQISEMLMAAVNVVREQPEPPNPRAVELWVETIAVAASSRVLYGEDPLGYDELRSSFDAWSWLVNSWMHSPP